MIKLPPFLDGIVKSETYAHWLERKARSHAKRDRQRGNVAASVPAYRDAIHAAVVACDGCDAYTGEPLDWTLIRQYDNAKSKAGGRKYKHQFALLPTVDHVGDGRGVADFRICSWRTNDAKHDLSINEFLALCKRVLAHHDQLVERNSTKGGLLSDEFESGSTKTTRIEYVNRNQQRCGGHRGVSGSDYVQVSYRMECLACGHVYGANGADVFQRKCPKCQGGAEGIPY